jgi:hypothetical protein
MPLVVGQGNDSECGWNEDGGKADVSPRGAWDMSSEWGRGDGDVVNLWSLSGRSSR